ncbi:MAG: substrate-binding domain-containing protein [Stellaceae bacterium]
MRGRLNLFRIGVMVAGVAALIGFSTPRSSAADGIKAPTAAQQAAAMAKLPADVRPFYSHYWYFAPIYDNPYAHWTPPKPPWQLCYNDSMLGTSWRTDLYSELKKLNAQYHKAGLTKAKVLATDSNNNISVQLTQFNNLSRQGCNVIFTIPSNPAGLCSGMKDAFNRGVLVITVQAAADCDDAINVGGNGYNTGEVLAQWVVNAIHHKGNVLILSGVPGISTTASLEAGSKAVLAKYPKIHLLGIVYGFWNEATSKTQMVKWLATHPEKIDGIISYGDMAVASDEALKQFGRPLAMQADGTNECAYIAYWHIHHLHSLAGNAGGGSMGYEAFLVGIKMLFGEKPIVNTIWLPPSTINDAKAAKLYKASMTPTSTCWADPPDHHLVADSYFSQFFRGGKSVEPKPNP